MLKPITGILLLYCNEAINLNNLLEAWLVVTTKPSTHTWYPLKYYCSHLAILSSVHIQEYISYLYQILRFPLSGSLLRGDYFSFLVWHFTHFINYQTLYLLIFACGFDRISQTVKRFLCYLRILKLF